MRVKSYFAGTVEAAIAQASKELGEEAMLVYSRESPPEGRHLGRYEVVFALADPQGAARAPALPGAYSADPVAQALASISRESRAMRERLEQLAARLEARYAVPRPRLTTMLSGGKGMLDMAGLLTDADVPEDLIAELIEEISAGPEQEAGCSPDDALRAVLARRLAVDASLSGAGSGPRVLALVGPPGSGKTTSLVKIAATHGVSPRRAPQLISFDTCRIAGAEQLRTYAGILGAGFQSVESGPALAQALEEHQLKDLVLIDTAGFCEKDLELASDLVEFLETNPRVDVHLVLPASMRPADLARAADRFAMFRPNKLLFTRLDETSCFGPLWAEAVKRAIPVSFLSNGQQIPEDFHEATRERVVDLLLGGPFRRAASGSPIPERIAEGVSAVAA